MSGKELDTQIYETESIIFLPSTIEIL